jgi:hypothetical protein
MFLHMVFPKWSYATHMGTELIVDAAGLPTPAFQRAGGPL